MTREEQKNYIEKEMAGNSNEQRRETFLSILPLSTKEDIQEHVSECKQRFAKEASPEEVTEAFKNFRL